MTNSRLPKLQSSYTQLHASFNLSGLLPTESLDPKILAKQEIFSFVVRIYDACLGWISSVVKITEKWK